MYSFFHVNACSPQRFYHIYLSVFCCYIENIAKLFIVDDLGTAKCSSLLLTSVLKASSRLRGILGEELFEELHSSLPFLEVLTANYKSYEEAGGSLRNFISSILYRLYLYIVGM